MYTPQKSPIINAQNTVAKYSQKVTSDVHTARSADTTIRTRQGEESIAANRPNSYSESAMTFQVVHPVEEAGSWGLVVAISRMWFADHRNPSIGGAAKQKRRALKMGDNVPEFDEIYGLFS